MNKRDLANLSSTVDFEALRLYRVAVGRRTQEIVKKLELEDLRRRVDPLRLQQLRDEGAVVEAAEGLLDY